MKLTPVFDSRLTNYANLSNLHEGGIKFITLRRRGSRLVDSLQDIQQRKCIHIPHGKRKHPNPWVHETTVHLPRNSPAHVRVQAILIHDLRMGVNRLQGLPKLQH